MVITERHSFIGAVCGLTIALIVLAVPIVISLYFAHIAMTGCLFGPCDNAVSDVPVAILWSSIAGCLIADVVLWGIAGYRRMPSRLVLIAVVVFMLPALVLIAGTIAGAV